ncbi:SAM-dependent methyltransferase [Actinoallomurus liliacearum]|uniref:SAM-dependent methyltransferase n=1 Tax=Actinoallomurus liliacearum TaxID=1080073 RepID=A0ABP8TJH7_9ACTN
MSDELSPPAERPKIDTSVPHSARIFGYWLGGKDNYPVDREAGDRVRELFPQIVDLARIGRYFLGRVVRYLAEEAGVRQFLDIGTGLPTVDNTHEVAQRVAPDARVVYVDNDPLVLAHAEALLTGLPEGATEYIHADVREPEKILAEAARTLDFDRPVAVILMGILAHVEDYDEARSIVRRLLDPLPPGSFLAIRDGVDTDPAYREALRQYNATGAVPYHLRSPRQLAGFLDGLEPIEPGVVSCPLWRPEVSPLTPEEDVALYGGIGRKP